MGITDIFRGFHALQRKQIWENINLRPRVSNDNIHIWLEMMRVLSLATQHVLNILFFISPILHDIKSLCKKAAEIRWNWVIIVIYISKHKKHFTIIFFKMQIFHLDNGDNTILAMKFLSNITFIWNDNFIIFKLSKMLQPQYL